MSEISLCPHCNAYIDTAQNPETCNICQKSLVGSAVGTSRSEDSPVTHDSPPPESPSASRSERDYVRCPTCNDLVSIRYRPVTCYKCGRFEVDPSVFVRPGAVAVYEMDNDQVYGGIGRLGYFLGFLGLAILNSIFTSGSRMHSEPSSVVSLIILVVSLTLIAMRLQNIGMSGWWTLLAFVPLANIWLGFTCLAAPEGYNDTKQMDTAGRVISAVFIGFILLIFLAVILFVVFR